MADAAAIRFDARMMSPAAIAETKTLDLSDDDRAWLSRLKSRAGAFEPLRAEIERTGQKGEQEAYRPWLEEQLLSFR